MNGKLCVVLFFYLFGASVCVHELKGTDLEDGSFEQGPEDHNSSEQVQRFGSGFLNYTLSKSVKRYYCASHKFNETDLLVFGTKSWMFPQQDVSLKLSYPTEENNGETKKHIITGLMVVLYINGNQSQGYITSGGILTESITLSFVLRDISMLSYQFWLYGVDETSSLMTEISPWNYSMC